MTITFTSNIKNGDKKNKIEFTSPVAISKMGDFAVYEFTEPQNNISNRIEVSSNEVNVFAGPSTVMLSLDKKIKNDYNSGMGQIVFDSEMKELTLNDDEIYFEYSLSQGNNIFGEFKIKLTINK